MQLMSQQQSRDQDQHGFQLSWHAQLSQQQLRINLEIPYWPLHLIRNSTERDEHLLPYLQNV